MDQIAEHPKILIRLLWFNLITLSITGYMLYFSILTDVVPILFLGIFLITVCSYFFSRKKSPNLISYEGGCLIISQYEDQQNLRLDCKEIQFFETRFNEIVFHHKENQQLSVKLDRIRSNKERWELKEFLRKHIAEHKSRREEDENLLGIS